MKLNAKLGADAGNHKVKICGEKGVFEMISTLGEYRDLRLTNEDSENGIVYGYKDRKGFAGTLAALESEFSGSMYGTTKAHEDTLIRILLGIAQYGLDADSYDIVVGQPIEQHLPDEKRRIKEMLIGDHEIRINDRIHRIIINRVEVAAEGGVAFWSNPKKGAVKILDFGSGTVNGAALLDGKYIDKSSFTLDFGLNTIRSRDLDAFMRAVFIETQRRRWNKDDKVLLVGGAAEELQGYVSKHFSNVELQKPKISTGGKIDFVSPIYANAVGMYNLAKEIYQ